MTSEQDDSGHVCDVLDMVYEETRRQDRLKAEGRFAHHCGDDEMSHTQRLAVVIEEVGEVARAVLEEGKLANDVHGVELHKELVQVAACCVKWAAGIDRRNGELPVLRSTDDEAPGRRWVIVAQGLLRSRDGILDTNHDDDVHALAAALEQAHADGANETSLGERAAQPTYEEIARAAWDLARRVGDTFNPDEHLKPIVHAAVDANWPKRESAAADPKGYCRKPVRIGPSSRQCVLAVGHVGECDHGINVDEGL
jgi:NTP pyrophosphatase (non-canonical NTP hydrolase)